MTFVLFRGEEGVNDGHLSYLKKYKFVKTTHHFWTPKSIFGEKRVLLGQIMTTKNSPKISKWQFEIWGVPPNMTETMTILI